MWDNRQHGENNIKARLDRFHTSSNWRQLFPATTVYHLGKFSSDHSPVLLDTNANLGGRRGGCRMVQFEQLWASDDEFEQKIVEGWSKSPLGVPFKIEACLENLDRWGSKKYGNIPRKIRTSQKKLEALYKVSHEPGKLEEIREEEGELDSLLSQEEQWLAQRSRAQWLKEGDKKHSFFPP
ncbi:Endonuclease/exonuclease/phosphatase superfamily [Sesbania bispinosa]|nr:Endonuclease/exonuclease/phosphatase superfamily [Sesbania bispinosa]